MIRSDAWTPRIVLAIAMVAISFGLTSCDEAFDGPQISRFALAPNSVSSSGQCGMSDQYFEAEAIVSGTEARLADGQLVLLDTPSGDRPADATVDTVETVENYQFD
jgi:hypothetical protein